MTKENPVEGDVKREAKKRLKKRGWFYFMPNAGAFGRSGISDTLALRKGVFVAIEMKLSKPTGTPLQEDFMRDVRDHGGLSFLCNQRSLDDGTFDAFLDKAEKIGDQLDSLG